MYAILKISFDGWGGWVDSIILRVCSGSNKGLGAKLLSEYDNLDYYKNVK